MKNTDIKPMVITDNETGETYTLEFSRDSVRFAEQRGFCIEELTRYPETNIPALFFYAFRKNHANIPLSKAEKLFDKLGGLTTEELARLVDLYHLPSEALFADEDTRKNGRMAVVL
jgi:hypothetical protein